jgi:hypothetical protein
MRYRRTERGQACEPSFGANSHHSGVLSRFGREPQTVGLSLTRRRAIARPQPGFICKCVENVHDCPEPRSVQFADISAQLGSRDASWAQSTWGTAPISHPMIPGSRSTSSFPAVPGPRDPLLADHESRLPDGGRVPRGWRSRQPADAEGRNLWGPRRAPAEVGPALDDVPPAAQARDASASQSRSASSRVV